MRREALGFLSVLAICAVSCGTRLAGSPGEAPPWKVGFWLWAGAAVQATAPGEQPFDVLYVQVGRVDSYFKNSTSWKWPNPMPAAKEYWALWRYDPPGDSTFHKPLTPGGGASL